MISANQTETKSCFPKKIPNTKTQCTSKRKGTYEPLKRTDTVRHREPDFPAKPSNQVSSRKRRPDPEISINSQKLKRLKMEISEDKPRERVFLCGSKCEKPSKPVDSCGRRSRKQVEPQKLTNSKGVDEEMSSEKALRVAILKSRFSDIIFKATHSTLFDNGVNSQFSKMQQHHQPEKEHLKEKAMVEAEVALRRATERITLEKMRQTVDLNNHVSLPGAPMGYPNRCLMRLGLRIK